MPFRKDTPNPYKVTEHKFLHFAWNVYHLLTYQFARYAIMAWILLIAATVVGFWKIQIVTNQNKELIIQNQERIADIQHSRIDSCQIIFEGGLRRVFKPLIPPKRFQTPKQKHNIKLFNQAITREKRRCIRNVLRSGEVK